MMRAIDVVVVGGGLVGASAALALAARGRAVTLIEAEAPRALAERWDERHFVLNRRSIEILDALGVFAGIARAVEPVRRVEVTRAGDFGRVIVDAEAFGFDALGWTVPARVLGAVLADALAAAPQITRRRARVTALDRDGHGVLLALDGDDAGVERLRARLVVGADGTDSAVRALSGIGADERALDATAIVGVVELARGLDGAALERLDRDGPLALLPLAGRRAGVVLIERSAVADGLLALPDAAYIDALRRRGGARLGPITKLGARQPWRLREVIAEQVVAECTVFVGNAAQTLHPIGAQGFNLGLRDALALAEALVDAEDPGAASVLANYAAARARDRGETIAFTRRLLAASAPESLLARSLRSVALVALDSITPLKRDLALGLMGWRGAAVDAEADADADGRARSRAA